MDNFKAVYKILSSLEKMMDLSQVNVSLIDAKTLGVSQERWNKYIEMMYDVGYIKGVSIIHNMLGEATIECENMQITLKGLEYLQENSIMKKMYNVAKGITDMIP